MKNSRKNVTRWRSLLKRYGGWAVPYVAAGMGVEAVNRRPRLKVMLGGIGVCGLAALFGTHPAAPSNGYLPGPGAHAAPSAPQTETSAKYKVVDLGTLGGENSQANGVSNMGSVAGVSEDSQGRIRGFLWKNGRMKDVGTLGGTHAIAYGVNDNDQTFGLSLLSGDETLHGFVTENGRIRDIGHLGLDLSFASGINNSGVVIGTAFTPDGEPKAVLWQGGKLKPAIKIKDFPFTVGLGINDSGAMAVTGFDDAGSVEGFLVQNGRVQKLPSAIQGGGAFAAAINQDNLVGGESFKEKGDSFVCTATLWKNGRAQGLPLLEGYPCTVLNALNAKGEAVGMAYTPSEEDCGEDNALRLPCTLNSPSPDDIRNKLFKIATLSGGIPDLRAQKSGIPHAFLYRNGKTLDLNSLIPNDSGWLLAAASGINNRGDITVFAVKGRQVRAVVLTPQ